MVSRLRKRDESALREVMERYNDKLFTVSNGICENLGDSEEVMLDVYMSLLEKIGQFERRSSLYTWLYRLTVNQALMKGAAGGGSGPAVFPKIWCRDLTRGVRKPM